MAPPTYPQGAEELYAGLSEAPLVVPVQLTSYLMRKCGQGPILYNMSADGHEYNEDMRMAQVVSFAAQRFLATVLNDTMQHQKLRRAAVPVKQKGAKDVDKRRVLRTEDLTQALLEQGVTLRTPPYYVDATGAQQQQQQQQPARQQQQRPNQPNQAPKRAVAQPPPPAQ